MKNLEFSALNHIRLANDRIDLNVSKGQLEIYKKKVVKLRNKSKLSREEKIFLICIFKNHPLYLNFKAKRPVDVQPLDYKYGANALYFIYADGSKESLSFNEVFKYHHTDSFLDFVYNRLIKNTRDAIESQIEDFRKLYVYDRKEFDVDHVIRFSVLLERWIVLNSPSKIKNELFSHGQLSEKTINNWKDYHKKNAQLQLLTIAENRGKKKSKIDYKHRMKTLLFG